MSLQEVDDECLKSLPEWLYFIGIGLGMQQDAQLCSEYKETDLYLSGIRDVQVGLVLMLDGEEICAFTW